MRTVAAGVVLLLAAVSGCSAEEAAPAEMGPLASASAEATARTPAESAPAVAPTESDSVPPVLGGGASATGQTAELEASAFVKRFFDVVNEAYARRDAADVRRMSAPECGSCAAVAQDVDRLAARNHVVAGRRYIVSFAAAAPARTDGKVVVDFRFDSDPYVERDSTGELVQDFPAERARDGQVLVDPALGRLRVTAIRLVDQ